MIDNIISIIFSISVFIYVIYSERNIKALREQNKILLDNLNIISSLYQNILKSFKENRKEENTDYES